ncbi:MAG: hypothetical protein PUF61_11115 [Spirochaetales bacterium]|nr:hypothetical protein [Spirochaetales bacterium]
MDETITLNLTGFHVEGTARVLLWNGDVAEVEMNAFHVDSLDDIPKNINDGQFGCQRILSAKCLVYKDYEGKAYRFYGVTDYEGDELSVAKRGV